MILIVPRELDRSGLQSIQRVIFTDSYLKRLMINDQNLKVSYMFPRIVLETPLSDDNLGDLYLCPYNGIGLRQ